MGVNLGFVNFLIITLLCSIASYYCIESKKWGVKLCVLYISVVVVGLLVLGTTGAAYRVPPKFRLTAQEYHARYYGGAGVSSYSVSNINKGEIQFIFIGDSVSRQYGTYLKDSGIITKNFFADGCLILPNMVNVRDGKKVENCQKFSDLMFNDKDAVANSGLPIVWSQLWSSYALIDKKGSGEILYYWQHKKQYIEKLKQELDDFINRVGQRPVFVIGENFRPNYNVFACLAEKELFWGRWFNKKCPEYQTGVEPEINSVLNNLLKSYSNVFFINPNLPLCHNGQCRVITPEGEPVFSDVRHLSIYGARIVGDYFIEKATKENVIRE